MEKDEKAYCSTMCHNNKMYALLLTLMLKL